MTISKRNGYIKGEQSYKAQAHACAFLSYGYTYSVMYTQKLTDDQETMTDTAEPIRDTIRPTTQADPAARRTNDPQQKIILCVKQCETQKEKIFF